MSGEFTTDPIDWSSPSWGGRIHVAVGGGVDAEAGDDQ